MNRNGINIIPEKQREYELKLMLHKEEYKKLAEMFPEEGTLQTNYYFDSSDFKLYKNKTVVRLRKRKETNEITVKTLNSKEADKGVVDMMERTIKIDDTEAQLILDGKIGIGMYLSAFEDIAVNKLSMVGKLETIRKKITLVTDFPSAELDESRYCDITDYELEWEINETDYETAVQALQNSGIFLEGRKTGISKYGRLVNCLQQRSE